MHNRRSHLLALCVKSRHLAACPVCVVDLPISATFSRCLFVCIPFAAVLFSSKTPCSNSDFALNAPRSQIDFALRIVLIWSFADFVQSRTTITCKIVHLDISIDKINLFIFSKYFLLPQFNKIIIFKFFFDLFFFHWKIESILTF